MVKQIVALHLTDAQLTVIMHQMNSHYPEEICGLLGGLSGVVHTVYPIPNVAPRPDIAFRMDPLAQVRAMSEIDLLGLDLLAIYHSHPPGSRSDPSQTDLQEATYPQAYTVIVVPSIHSGLDSIRAFTINDMQAVEVPIVINSE